MATLFFSVPPTLAQQKLSPSYLTMVHENFPGWVTGKARIRRGNNMEIFSNAKIN
jgi:hypothetical protein